LLDDPAVVTVALVAHFSEGDAVRARGAIRRGLLDDGYVREVRAGSVGRVIGERLTVEGVRYEVAFETPFGVEVLDDVRHDEIAHAFFGPTSPQVSAAANRSGNRGGGGGGIGMPDSSEAIVGIGLVFIALLAGGVALGGLAWCWLTRFPLPRDFGAEGNYFWVGGAAVGLGILAVRVLCSGIWARRTVSAALVASAIVLGAFVAPELAHRAVDEPYIDRYRAGMYAADAVHDVFGMALDEGPYLPPGFARWASCTRERDTIPHDRSGVVAASWRCRATFDFGDRSEQSRDCRVRVRITGRYEYGAAWKLLTLRGDGCWKVERREGIARGAV
jgi:hypothetical protein